MDETSITRRCLDFLFGVVKFRVNFKLGSAQLADFHTVGATFHSFFRVQVEQKRPASNRNQATYSWDRIYSRESRRILVQETVVRKSSRSRYALNVLTLREFTICCVVYTSKKKKKERKKKHSRTFWCKFSFLENFFKDLKTDCTMR